MFPLANSTANIEKESWIDCRDFIEENVQQQRYTVSCPARLVTRPIPRTHPAAACLVVICILVASWHWQGIKGSLRRNGRWCSAQEMMETAVLLVVDLVACPGQGSIDLKKLCRACDEARIKWGASATARGLQLVRWSCTTWYLFSSLGEQGLKHRPVVREVAECALEMEAAWRDVMREHSLLVHSFNAGLVVGSLFASYDGGKFLSSLAGRAFDTARQLAEESRSVGTRGCILAMDAVMEALRHTHDVALEGSNYRLVRAIRLPFDYSMRHLMGSEADTDPVSPGPGRGPGQPAAWNDSHGDGSLNKATLITAGVEQSAAGSSRKLKVEIPSPNQAAGQPVGTPSSHPALIGYGPDALVTPGGYGKPLALKPNFMTQATMAHRHVTTRSFRELKAALSTDMPVTPGGTLVTDWESPQHDESGVLNRSLNAKSFHGQPGAANPRDHSHKKKSKESAKERQPPKPEPSSLSLCKDFASAQTPVANVAHSKRSNLGRLSSSSRLDATSSTAAGVYKPGSSMPNQEPPCEGPLRTLRVHQAVNHKTARSQTIKLSAMKVARQALGSSAVRAAATAHFPQQPKDAIDCILQETVRPERTRSPLSESTRRIGFSNLNVSTASPKSSSSSPVSSKSPVRSHRSMLSPLRATEIGQPNVVEDAAHVEAAAEYHPHYGDLLHGHHKRNIRFEGQGSKDGPPDAEWHFAGRTESDAVQNEGVSGLPIHKTLSLTVDVQVDPNDHFLHEQPSEGSRHLADGDAAPGYRERAGFPSTRRMSARAGERQNELDVLRVSKDCGSMHSAKQYVSSIPSGSMVVVLSLAGLVELPPMGHLLYLEMLAASHNRIVTVPAADMWMGLSRLQNLVLAHNQIAALPPDMFRAMHNLKELNLASNCLQEIPRSLWSVKSLRVLCLTGNKLQHLPPQVSELVSLEQLHCGRNEITSIPIQLASLASLSVLDMGYNKLDNVPGDLAKLTSLRKLSLSGNQLTALPVEMMSSLRCLEHLQLAGNAFREIWSEETANLIVEPLEDFTGLPSDYVQEEQPPGGSIEPTPRDWQGSVHSMLTEETDDSRDEKHSILELIQLLTPRTAMLGMAEASSDFIAFPSLKALDLSNNKLKVIPEWVPPGVEELLLSFNRLVEIPEWLPLRLRVSLKLIDVHHNSIVDLPKGMRLLRNVELMALRDNPLVAPGSGPIAEAFSRGCTATQIVDILKKKPLRKLRLAATLVSRTIGQTMALRNYLADQKCGQKTETGN